MLTRAQTRTLVRSLLTDDDNVGTGDHIVDFHTQLVLDDLWAELLDESPWFNSQLDTLTSGNMTTPGFVDLSLAGPLTKRFYRVQRITRGDSTANNVQEYYAVSPHDAVQLASQDVHSERFSYYIIGSQLWLFPLDVTVGVELRYAYLPPAFTSLLDTATVTWPDGLEMAFVAETAARVTDSDAVANKQHAIGQAVFDRTRRRIKREYVGPAVINTSDSPFEWGGT